MKILQITNKLPLPARDGGSIASFRLCSALSQIGHELTLFALNTSKHYIDEELWKPLAQEAGIQVIAVKVNTQINIPAAATNLLFSKLPYNAVRFRKREVEKQLIKVLKSHQFDAIIIENLYPFLYLSAIKKHSDARIIMRAHNIEHEIWQRTADHSSGLKQAYLKNLAKRIRRFEVQYLNTYDYLAPITERDRMELNKLGNTKPSMALPTGMLIAPEPPEIDTSNRGQIAHLGALDWGPNQEGILWFLNEVWPRILKKIPDATFHIAGRNAPMWFVKALKKPGVHFHGEVKVASDFIHHFPIHVVPLWSGSGMRIKIIEAMALARVIVTTPIGVEGIPAKHKEQILINDTPEDFSAAVVELIENPEQLQKLSKNAFTFVRNHFENTKLVASFIRFIQENEQVR